MQNRLSSFLKELKHRKVYRVATVYAITGWIIIEVTSSIFPYLHLPDWLVTAIIVLILIGFPIALVMSWIFDIGPEGFVRTGTPEAENNPFPERKRKPFTGTVTIIVLSVLLVGQFVYFKFIPDRASAQDQVSAADTPLPAESIAVLPFKNLSEDQDNVYFSDGVMEAILNNLSRIRDLKVVSRTSVEQYRDNIKPIPEIASELEVGNILEGSVQKMGNNVRITVQLISADQDEHIWASHYDRDISDLFVVQSEIARTIAENLKVILTSEEREIIEDAPTSNLVAYDLYLQASKLDFDTENEMDRAMELLQNAIHLDSTFSLAYGLFGLYLSNLDRYNHPETIWRDSALVMLKKSVELDPTNTDAYLYEALIYQKSTDWDNEKKYLLKALRYDPNNFLALKRLGNNSISTGDYERGIDYLLRSLSVNKLNKEAPDYYKELGKVFLEVDWELAMRYFKEGLKKEPGSYYLNLQLAYLSLGDKKASDALAYAKELVYLRPDLNWSYTALAFSYLMLQQYEKAEEYFSEAKTLFEKTGDEEIPYLNTYLLGYVKIKLGKTEEGQALMSAFRNTLLNYAGNERIVGGFPDAYLCLGSIAATGNHREEAFTYLENGMDAYLKGGSTYDLLWTLRLDPCLDNLREDQRFKTMVMDVAARQEEKKQILRSKLSEYHDRNELTWISLI
ncbi:MAG: hypothetical protein ACWGNV_13580 [Bacteroidales bacterium]